MNIPAIEKKWIRKWHEAKTFETNPDPKKKKFFLTFPYPYINLYPHMGHFYSLMKVEAYARYKRMQGYNVLFPQGWHITGAPIEMAAQRVAQGEEKQIKILKDMGFSDDEIPLFKDPLHWVKTFGAGWKEDLTNVGISIDWRRNFYTTSLNPHYNKFIEWQFRTLKKKGYCKKGKYPVIWCPSCNNPISDHARVEGEGENPQEFTLLKFRYQDDNTFLVAATMRPETVFGQTNMWVDPDIIYVKAKVDNEYWIMSTECTEKLKLLEHTVDIVEEVPGKKLIGTYCTAPMINKEIIILPSAFCDPDIGTGLVTSVPSHAPFDWMGIYDLQESQELCKKYGLSHEEIKKIKPIALITLEGWGEHPAVEICEKWGIKNQQEFEKLEKAKKEIYKAEHYAGVMKKNTGRFAGMKVEEAKELVKKELIEKNQAALTYEPTGKVVCRCLTEAVVKIVSDQWFITYGDPEWKKTTQKCLDSLKLFPEKARAQFNYVIDWLTDKPCTRDHGLGTSLPWDKKWIIESLSDSTIYMAYYTIAHRIKDVDPEKLDDAFFDYIFLNKGSPEKIHINQTLADEFKKEFEYWYPLDLRNSGKDLIQNHLSFMLFNHTAIFPEKHWPQAISVNGWVTVDGEKMSKSRGNVISLRDMQRDFSADAARLTILSGGEGLDDPNWDSELARSTKTKLAALTDFITTSYNQGREQEKTIDMWMQSQLSRILHEYHSCMEATLFRSAIQSCYYELQRVLRWYLRRTNNQPHKETMNATLELQLLMLAPFTPFFCEECWERIGKKGCISLARLPDRLSGPEPLTTGIGGQDVILQEKLIQDTLEDINAVLKLTKTTKPQTILLFVAPVWKYEFFTRLGDLLRESRDQKHILQSLLSDHHFKEHAPEVAKLVGMFLRQGKTIVPFTSQESELHALSDAKDFLEKEYQCPFTLMPAEKTQEKKAHQAQPAKPAILVS
ncbi:leucine--tRNA ligase [Candidatus Woesearchaeota archaeon CG_4_10_14_0_8_um_filter_47_5]|nr:MAG: leucine--tRNA ligase [Candidatus Woesearchaeota archaeon CG_4_10_14_0_8_um_filter_47_5]